MGCTNVCIALLCVYGAGLSLYEAYIGAMMKVDPTYKAACDLDETIQCSRVITSKYGSGIGLVEDYLGKDHFLNVPNPYLGIIMFPLLFVLGAMKLKFVASAPLQIPFAMVFFAGIEIFKFWTKAIHYSFSESRYVTGFAVLVCFVSCLSSAYLLYVLMYVLEKICLVCIQVHIISLLLFIFFTVKARTIPTAEVVKPAAKKKQY